VNCTYDVPTNTIVAEWSTFTRLPNTDRLIIRFQVTGSATLTPGQTVTNVANVQWTSELGPQEIPDSFSNPPNSFATERFYDPASPNPINTIYGDSDNLVLNPVGGGGGGGGGGTTTTGGTGPFILVSGGLGFAPDVVTPLNAESKPAYDSSNLTLSIPSIKMSAPIAGVDFKDGMWDASWLQNQAGWLEGTAYPTWSGNSVIGGHVVGADGKPSIFYRLKYVEEGAYIYVYNSGYRYTYKVISNDLIQPHAVSVLDHSENPMLTLITCDQYDVKTGLYKQWVMVRAVLVDVSAGR
jgi:LPXTG-site transpeptidase (sortase) family protein